MDLHVYLDEKSLTSWCSRQEKPCPSIERNPAPCSPSCHGIMAAAILLSILFIPDKSTLGHGKTAIRKEINFSFSSSALINGNFYSVRRRPKIKLQIQPAKHYLAGGLLQTLWIVLTAWISILIPHEGFQKMQTTNTFLKKKLR